MLTITSEKVELTTKEFAYEFVINRGVLAAQSWRDIMQQESPSDYGQLTLEQIAEISDHMAEVCEKLEAIRI